MKQNNWVPISKCLSNKLPKDRKYSEVEAMFSLQCDYSNNKKVSVSGYSKLWKWSRKKINKFFKDIGVEIIYSENTTKKQNQKGQIRIQIRDRSGTDMEQIEAIDSKDSERKGNRYGTDKGQIRDRSGYTTSKKKDIDKELEKKYSDKQKEFVEAFTKKIKRDHPNNSPKGNNIIQKQLDTIDKLVRLDGHPEETVFKTIEWATKDEFWANQVFSLSGLRKISKNGLTKFQNILSQYEMQITKSKPIEKLFKSEEDVYNGY